jgi:hypothetical protein
MLKSACSRAVRAALLGLAIGLVGLGQAQESKEVVVPEGDYPKLVDAQLKAVDEGLKALKDATDKDQIKKMKDKARCGAVMIAAAAQDNLAGKDGQQRATVRDAALNLAALVKGEKYDDAAKLAGELKGLKEDPKAKKEKIKLFEAHIDLQELMSQFKQPKAGGQGVEKLLLNLATDKKKMVPPAAINDALLATTYQVALLSELAHEYVPPKDKKDWDAWSVDMKKGALEMADKLKAKDGKAAFTALNKLNTSCSVCHERFKK